MQITASPSHLSGNQAKKAHNQTRFRGQQHNGGVTPRRRNERLLLQATSLNPFPVIACAKNATFDPFGQTEAKNPLILAL